MSFLAFVIAAVVLAITPGPGIAYVVARTVAVRQSETINARALTAMFKQIIANNRAGGWRKLKRDA